MTLPRPHTAKWEFWIDRGGTFTDVVARRPDGTLATHKLLSENPEQYRDAAIAGIRHVLGLKVDQPIPTSLVSCVKMGTTVATNALLERKGTPTVLVTSRGFRDALRIGYQERPQLFVRQIVLPELVYAQVLEADERIDAQGNVVIPLDQSSLRLKLRDAYEQGYRSVAIVFMHAYRQGSHELVAGRIAQEIGFTQVSLSHQVSPLIKLVGRGDTTVVDAYLSPILRRYVDQVASEMPGVDLYFMQSSGGLCDAQTFQGKDAILSGPAGGIIGMARTAEQAGFGNVVGFDMGGTSTDVSHYAGEFERSFETQIAGVRMRSPMMSIHTVAAGGGSILHFDGARMRVGPDSAGASPGPACYRRGGPLALTDANLMLGKLHPAYFPQVFGPHGNQSLDPEVVATRFDELATRVKQTTGIDQTAHAIAEGFVEIAVANMANAIKRISVARGYDVTRYTLQCFGGAGGQHACLVADVLGIPRVLVHPLAGVLSAYGMGLADQRAMREVTIEHELSDESWSMLWQAYDRLESEARAELQHYEADRDSLATEYHAHVRYQGTDTSLMISIVAADRERPGRARLRALFEEAYQLRFGFLMQERALIIAAASLEVIAAGHQLGERSQELTAQQAPPVAARVAMWSAGQKWEAALIEREQLLPGHVLEGPAIIAENTSTIVVEPQWRATITQRNHVLLERSVPRQRQRAIGADVDPVMLEVFNNLFMNIAEQMGAQLQNTAYSVNIKERLDFSCALFDAQGKLVANAPHMPVHLGSMSESIQAVIAAHEGRMRSGDVYALNDPYRGGTHLPDVTVVTPVFDEFGEQVLFYLGSRGHHADIGGITPGSMPPYSTRIEEEGVRIDNLKIVDAGHFQESELRALLTSGVYPARNPDQNIADLNAQIAANAKGVQELHKVVREFGLQVVQSYMQHVQDNAEECVRRVITRLRNGSYELELDNGARVIVEVHVDAAKRSATLDFSRSSAQLASNFNSPRAVCTAAVLYVFRTLVDDDIPLNAGCLKPLHLIVPEGSMLNPRPPAAVVAGNVETSMCITNALYGALGVMAASQCTMNNFTFGNDRLQYYETIAGGSGAGPGFDGQSVVQTHMTNSRLTDPEVLELRFPVHVESFEIRNGSGGLGMYRGGDGAIRRIRFLAPMTASILSNGRHVAAFGMAGGEPGALGKNWVQREKGMIETLEHIGSCEMLPGDVFVIETPGGGGYGEKQ